MFESSCHSDALPIKRFKFLKGFALQETKKQQNKHEIRPHTHSLHKQPLFIFILFFVCTKCVCPNAMICFSLRLRRINSHSWHMIRSRPCFARGHHPVGCHLCEVQARENWVPCLWLVDQVIEESMAYSFHIIDPCSYLEKWKGQSEASCPSNCD